MFRTVKPKSRFQDADEVVAGLALRQPDAETADLPRVRADDRVKTRFLGFRFAAEAIRPPQPTREKSPADDAAGASLTIVSGPGEGKVFSLTSPFVQIGRGAKQDVQLDFGDTSISRACHASIACYGGEGLYMIRDGLKPNPVLLNGVTLNGESRLSDGDIILIGETTLRFSRA